MMSKFWKYLQESIILQGVVTVLVLGTLCALLLMGKPVPEGLWRLAYLIVGVLFGSKMTGLMRKGQ